MGRLNLDNATFSRPSYAFNPYTGERVLENVLRRNPGRLRVLDRMFTSADPVAFAPGMTRMTYAQLLTRQSEFETNLALRTRPTGSIQAIPGDDVVDGEWFTMYDGATSQVFYFDKGPASPPSFGAVAINVNNGWTAAQVASAIQTAITGTLLIAAAIDPDDATIVLLQHANAASGGNADIDVTNISGVGWDFQGMDGGTDGFVEKYIYGQSEDGRDLVAYHYGDIQQPAILFVCGIHGNEVDGVEGFFTFLETLHARRATAWKAILDEHSIWFIPSANPDGWVANLRNLSLVGPNGLTVNLNRNFPFFWDAYIESDAESKGAAPAGEPGASLEADALYDFTRGQSGPFVDHHGTIAALVDHHENIGQGHRYISANRINSFGAGERFNSDFDALRLQGSMRLARGAETLFVQFRRSKNVPYYHSWAASLGIIEMAMESRKDEPEGATGNNKWVFDATFSVCVALTSSYWRYEDTVTIEQEATNLVDGQGFGEWQTDNVAPSGFSRSRCTGERVTDQELFPHNSGASVKVTTELAVDPDEATPSWAACSLGDIVLAVGRKPSIAGDLQSMILSSETVATGPGPTGTPPGAATRGLGMVFSAADFSAAVIGGWSEDGNTLKQGGCALDAFNPGLSSPSGSYGLPAPRADMGYANDGANWTVYVGGSIGVVSSPFVAPVDGKILKYSVSGGAWTDTGLTIPARKFPCVVHRPGTDQYWIFGGEDASGVPLDDIWVFDRAANTVTQSSTDLADPMSRIAGAAYGTNCIYLYGGRYEVSPGVYENDGEVRKFVPSTEVLTVDTVLANLEDEASHDETIWFKRLAGGVAARRVAGNGEEIFLVGGKTGEVASEVDQPDFYVHRPSNNTLTFARDGIYALFSRLQDITVTAGEWLSISTWAKTVTPGATPYHRAALTLKTAGGSWLRHGRTYYEVPFSDRYEWFRTSIKVAGSEVKCRPYLRTYVHDSEILYAQHMVAKRSRASSYHPTTREAETLTYSEDINLNNFRLRFVYNPTFGFVNVGEDLELCRIESVDDATDYISLTLMEETGKTYHVGSGFVAAQYPRVLLRKYISGVQVAQVEDFLYYGYDARSSNVEHVNDPVEFDISHQALARLGLGIVRYGRKGYAENRFPDASFPEGSPGRLIIQGEGEYGVPELLPIKTRQPLVDKINRGMARMKSLVQNCIHPGEPNAA